MRQLVRRWYWWLPALVVAAGLGYVGYRATHPPWEGTEAWEKYQKIGLGMTRQEVEAIMGRGPDKWTKTSLRYRWNFGDDEVGIDTLPLAHGPGVIHKWVSIGGTEFDEPPESWWDRWRARLGW